MDKYILIVAGGKGSRLHSEMPKQLIDINGLPLLMWTFKAFEFLKNQAHFVLVLNPDLIGPWKSFCQSHQFEIHHEIVEGGPKRFHSVKNGLNLIPDNALVAIHDAARPLVQRGLINEGFTVALRKGNAVPAIAVQDSMRMADGSVNQPVDRNKYRIIQTPQTFHAGKIKKAYFQSYDERFTDDASVFESTGEPIQLIEGDRLNIKITTSEDLLFASALLHSA
jgi:2-C-methyl-D-erythritol 4-phosphate cytidylyltransferase